MASQAVEFLPLLQMSYCGTIEISACERGEYRDVKIADHTFKCHFNGTRPVFVQLPKQTTLPTLPSCPPPTPS